MKEKQFKELEKQYIELFRERPWILRYLNITEDEKLQLLRKAIEEKQRIEIEEE